MRNNHQSAVSFSPVIGEINAWILIVFLAHIAVTKLQNTDALQFELSTSPVLYKQARVLSYLIPITEALTVVLLLIKRLRTWGFILVILLGVINLIGLYTVTARFPHFRGGLLHQLSTTQHLAIDVIAVLLGVGGLLLTSGFPLRINKRDIVPIVH